jgi:penicillin amidase
MLRHPRRAPGTSRRLTAFALAGAFALVAPALSAQGTSPPIKAPGLAAAGTITYDAEGIPVIQAASENDAALLQGYAHARDRFFQMDVLRRNASGTLAELVGPAALAGDVQSRTLGLRRAAFATWAAMSTDTRGWLQAYANGVNLWLRSNPLPPEYGALELTRAEPWSALDSVVCGKALAFNLSFDTVDLELSQRAQAFGAAGQTGNFNGIALLTEDLYRTQPIDNRVSIPDFRPSDQPLKSIAAEKAVNYAAMDPVSPEVGALASRILKRARSSTLLERNHFLWDRGAGSNWWILAGSVTDSGRPIYANDPHLSLGTPSLFSEVNLQAPGLSVAGVSLPGAPGVLQGCTPRFCWGSTVNPLDTTDFFQETFVLNTYGLPTHTIFQGRQEPVQLIVQLFFVNRLDGAPDNVTRENSIGYLNGAATIIVPRRNNGPVLSISGNSGISAQYTGWGPTFELDAFRSINKASTLEQFRTALSQFDIGSQNFGYADVDGNIAYFTMAETPVRDDLQNLRTADGGVPPFFVRDGSGTRRHQWLPVTNRQPNQAVPFEILGANEMPFSINPSRGYIANANNDPIGTTLDNNALNQLRPNGGLYYLNVGYAPLRIGRIDRLIQARLASGQKATLDDVRRWQSNNQPLDAEILLPYLLQAAMNAQAASAWADLRAIAQNAQVADAIARLRAWDFSTPTGIREGFDPGDNPASLPDPSASEIANSVAATLYAGWRSFAVRNTIDATLARIGLANQGPGSGEALSALNFHLAGFAQRRGVGVSGVNFFQVANAPNPEAARDFLLLKSMADALALYASEGFAPAFNRSTSNADYRWGRLHRIEFRHPLGGPFNLPGQGLYGFTNLSAQLPGVARPGAYEVVDDSDASVRANTVNGFMFGGGPARRFVGSMTSPPRFQQILPGGPSGVLGNPRYASQLGRWLTNNFKPLEVDAAAATANPSATLRFEP